MPVTRHPTKQAKKPRTIGSRQQRFMRVSGQVCACQDKFAIVHSLTPNGQYLYHILSLRPNSCFFQFCTSKFINIAYLIVLCGSDMLELYLARGNLGCRHAHVAQADR